jgi:hypothetical protein
MKSAHLILALLATSSVLLPVRAASPVMSNYTIQAMLSGGVPLPAIIRAIKTAKQVDLYMNDREYARFKAAGASKSDADQIMQAIHSREYDGIDNSPAEPVVRVSAESVPVLKPAATVPPVAPVSVAAPPVPVSVAPAVPAVRVPEPWAPPIPLSSAETDPGSVASTPHGPVYSSPRMILEDATPVRLRLARNLSSADATTGETVEFEVLEEVTVGDQIVIPKGAVAWGTVTDVETKKRMGRAGKLDVNIDAVRLADGQKAALRGVKDVKGGGHVGAVTTGVVLTSLVFWPAAPLFLLRNGKDATIPTGTEVTAYINGNMTLDIAKFAPAR